MEDLLWMSEDELRWQCNLLRIRLFQSEALRLMQMEKAREAYEIGFQHGATEAVVRLTCSLEEGNVECYALH